MPADPVAPRDIDDQGQAEDRKRHANVPCLQALKCRRKIRPGIKLVPALRDGDPQPPAWQTREEVVAFSARGQDWCQRVWFDQVGTASYVAGGTVEPD